MSDWVWEVSCYYGDDTDQPGELAIRTVHKTDMSKDMEVAAAEAREDVGEIVVTRLRT